MESGLYPGTLGMGRLLFMHNNIESLEKEYRTLIDVCSKCGMNDILPGLENKLRDLHEPLKVMIVGEGNSGKSTLVNALLGMDVAPVDSDPLTWCINIYCKTKGKPYAEIVYSNDAFNRKRCSYDEARELLDRISKERGTLDDRSVTEGDKKIEEIWWYINSEWPEGNAVIIDTPGINQIRIDTGFSDVVIDGVDGIHMKFYDGFDRYYYKADLVLWCFEASNVGDSVIQETLDKVSVLGKKIYGIITRLDKHEGDDPHKLIERNRSVYSKYLVACIPSRLPPVFEAMKPEEKEKRRAVRELTISKVKGTIRFLLEYECTKIKLESSDNYLRLVKKQVTDRISDLCEFYYQNYKICEDSISGLSGEIDRIHLLAINELDSISGIDDNLASRDHLKRIWDGCNGDLHAFEAILTEELKNGELARYRERKMPLYRDCMGDKVSEEWDMIRWKNIVFSKNDSELKYSETPKRAEISLKTVERNTKVFISNSLLLPTVLAYFAGKKMAAVLGDGSIGNMLNEFSNSIMFNNICADASSQITENNHNSISIIRELLDKVSEEYRGWFVENVKASFKNQTGVDVEKTKDRIFENERLLFSMGADDGVSPLYPSVMDGRIVFIPSKYSQLLHVEPDMTEAAKLLVEQYIKPYMDVFARKETERMREALSGFNGTAAVCEIRKPSASISQEKDFTAGFLNWDRIVWSSRGMDVVLTAYKAERKETIKRIENELKQEIAFVEQKVVGERISLARAKLDKGVKTFAEYWRNFAWRETREYLEKGRLSVLPPSWDYKDYYGVQYIRMFSNEKIMKLIFHYRNKGSVEEWFIKEHGGLDTKGNTLNGMVEREIAKIIKEKLKQLDGALDDVKKMWDDSVRNQYSAYYSVHTQFMTSFKQRLEQRVKPKWERYLSDGNIKNKDLSLIQFAVKMGEFSKKELLFLQGKSDIDFRGAILFSNGKTFSQTAKEELGG